MPICSSEALSYTLQPTSNSWCLVAQAQEEEFDELTADQLAKGLGVAPPDVNRLSYELELDKVPVRTRRPSR